MFNFDKTLIALSVQNTSREFFGVAVTKDNPRGLYVFRQGADSFVYTVPNQMIREYFPIKLDMSSGTMYHRDYSSEGTKFKKVGIPFTMHHMYNV